jgi:hypothetical protein
VEQVQHIAKHCLKVVTVNGCANSIKVVQKDARFVKTGPPSSGAAMQDRADIMVFEVRGLTRCCLD